ncbi:MAG: hypothetical protein J6Q06_03075, partial [Clostridia bacterium]|nr:hypothetical protein [Clostridia bacterium]
MTKFFEQFTEKSNGAFPELKFNSATYHKTKQILEVRFIISAFDSEMFDEHKMASVKSVVESLFPGISIIITYIRTYADRTNVVSKVYEYFNKFEQLLFKYLSDKNIKVEVAEKEIDVKITFDTPAFILLKNTESDTKLKEYLDENFNGNISVGFVENVVDISNVSNITIPESHTPQTTEACRLIKTVGCDKVYSRGKVSGVTQMPSYISDIKQPTENIVLCGKISGLQHKEYKNKRYAPDDPNSKEPEMKPMFRCMLNDTTAQIECVCFPRQSDVELLKSLNEDDEVICLGNVTVSTYNGQLSYALDGIFRCSIQFDSIQRV